MRELLSDEKYSFISRDEKDFVVAFDKAITKIGYENSGIQPYVCFGKYKIEYWKSGLKSKKIVARFYFRDSDIILRLYFTNIDKYREYIENSPDFIKNPFINNRGKCKQCDKSGGGIGKKGKCSFKKSYTIDNILYEKCAGENYYFDSSKISNIPKYIELLTVFYPEKKLRNAN